MRILLVPGGGGSGPEHWDWRWQAMDDRVERVVQLDWINGPRERWLDKLDRQIASTAAPVILVCHSLGCIAACHWALQGARNVRGVLLVAPADVEADWAPAGSLYRAFSPIPMTRLPFPSLLVASSDDPYLSLDRAQAFGEAWGSEIHIAGALGHIGSASNLGDWQEGRHRLDQLLALCGPSGSK